MTGRLAARVDEAVVWRDGSAYCFCGAEYVSYDIADDTMASRLGHAVDNEITHAVAGRNARAVTGQPSPWDFRALPPFVDRQLALVGFLVTCRRLEVLVSTTERDLEVDSGRSNGNDPLRKIVGAALKDCFHRVGHGESFP